jgi:hypothetical protein
MQLGFAFLADAAVSTPDGKISVLGGNFDTIYVAAVPAQHPAMVLVVNLRVQPTECGRQHRLRLEFWDPDGQSVLPSLELPFLPQRRSDQPHKPVNVNLTVHLQGLTIPRVGDYAFHVLVDDLEVGVMPLSVVQVQAPGTAGERGAPDHPQAT